jgi:hypothetical protein
MFRTPQNGWRYPAPLMHPPVMAIGDSLFNGMRSASITETYARESVPAQIGRAIAPEMTFLHPRYPEPILIDLEAALARQSLGHLALTIDRKLAEAVANARRWLGQYLAGNPDWPPCWDNLAISGGEVTHLIDTSAADWRAAARKLAPVLDKAGSLTDLIASGEGGKLVDLHMAINGAFLINPQALPQIDRLRPIDVVAARQPRRLLVSIGPNHGLIDITLRGDVEGGSQRLAKLPDEMARLAEMLVDLPPAVQHIHISTLLMPSTVPNLVPVDYLTANPPKPGPDGYFPLYYRALGELARYGSVTAKEMAELDRFVAGIVAAVERSMLKVFAKARQDRLHFFRVGAALLKYDGKHDPAKKITGRSEGQRRTPGADLLFPNRSYSNLPTRFDDMPFGLVNFRGGGLCGLDNHHPSSLGYSVFARELLASMKRAEPGLDPVPIPITERADSLIKNYPTVWSSVVDVLETVKRSQIFDRDAETKVSVDLDRIVEALLARA